MDLTEYIFVDEVPPDKLYELLTTRWGLGHNLAVTFIDHYGGHIYDIFQRLEFLNDKGEYFEAVSQAQTNSVQMCLAHDGDKKRMRELLTQIAVKGFAPLSKKQDPEAELISQNNVGGLVQRDQATVIGLPDHLWGDNTIGLVASKQSIRLVIARVHTNPEVLADNSMADSTSVAYESKTFGAIDEQLIGLKAKIEIFDSDIKACSFDPDERAQLRLKKEQLRKKREQ